MIKFKPGDKVVCVDNTTQPFNSNLELGNVYTIRHTHNDNSVSLEEKKHYIFFSSRFVHLIPHNNVSYPYDPHPQAEVMKAWLDGAAIEARPHDDDAPWYPWGTKRAGGRIPLPLNNAQYRVAPNQDKYKKRIALKENIKKLQTELKQLDKELTSEN